MPVVGFFISTSPFSSSAAMVGPIYPLTALLSCRAVMLSDVMMAASTSFRRDVGIVFVMAVMR